MGLDRERFKAFLVFSLKSSLGPFFCPYKRFVPRLVGWDLKEFSRFCSRLVLKIRSAISCFKIQAVYAIILRSAFWALFFAFGRSGESLPYERWAAGSSLHSALIF